MIFATTIMARNFGLSFSLCFLLLFTSACLAEFDKFNECQLDRINALEPDNRVESEAGLIESWNSKHPELRCAGVAVVRRTIQPNGLHLPSYTPAPHLIMIVQGRGALGLSLPGCAETYQEPQSQSRRQGRRGGSSSSSQQRDSHHKIRHLRQGDIVAIPPGVPYWTYNYGNQSLIAVSLLDTSNLAHQLDSTPRVFYIGGNPEAEFPDTQRQQQSHHHRGRRHGQHQQDEDEDEEGGSVLSGFSSQFIAQAFDTDDQTARQLKNNDRPQIVRVKDGLSVISPTWEEEGDEEDEDEDEYEEDEGRQWHGRHQSRGGRGRREREEDEDEDQEERSMSRHRQSRSQGRRREREEEEEEERGQGKGRGPHGRRERRGREDEDEDEDEEEKRGQGRGRGRRERESQRERRGREDEDEDEEEERRQRRGRGGRESRLENRGRGRGRGREDEDEDEDEEEERGQGRGRQWRESQRERRGREEQDEDEDEEEERGQEQRQQRRERERGRGRREREEEEEEDEDEEKERGQKRWGRGQGQRQPGRREREEEDKDEDEDEEVIWIHGDQRGSRGRREREDEDEEERRWSRGSQQQQRESRRGRGRSEEEDEDEEEESSQSQSRSRGHGGRHGRQQKEEEDEDEEEQQWGPGSRRWRRESQDERGIRPRERREGRGGHGNGLEETVCTAKIIENIARPSRANFYNPRAGRISTLNSLTLPVLRYFRLSAQYVVLYKNGIYAPHWNLDANSVMYVTRGRGRVRIVNCQGNSVFNGEVRRGQLLVVPQNFVVAQEAGNEGFEYVVFKTNDRATTSHLKQVFRGIPAEVLANAFGLKQHQVSDLKYNGNRGPLVNPQSQSQPSLPA